MHILRFINITIKNYSIVYVNRLVNSSITGLIYESASLLIVSLWFNTIDVSFWGRYHNFLAKSLKKWDYPLYYVNRIIITDYCRPHAGRWNVIGEFLVGCILLCGLPAELCAYGLLGISWLLIHNYGPLPAINKAVPWVYSLKANPEGSLETRNSHPFLRYWEVF